jgi:homoserine kinase
VWPAPGGRRGEWLRRNRPLRQVLPEADAWIRNAPSHERLALSLSQAPFCRAFAPGSIGNLACGFDVMGMALEGPGDEVVARLAGSPGLVVMGAIYGDGGRLPLQAERNTAGAAAQAVLDELGVREGVELDVHKGLPLAAGMGGSAASAVAAVVAVDGLISGGLPAEILLRCALVGEAVATGASPPDNAGPSLLGGVVLVPVWDPLRAIQLKVPRELWAVHVHPHLEGETAAARQVLGDRIPLRDAVAQWGNTAALVAGLFMEDWEIIARAFSGGSGSGAPPGRIGVPGFHAVKGAALEAGALAASLSGSGPGTRAGRWLPLRPLPGAGERHGRGQGPWLTPSAPPPAWQRT